MIYKKIKKATFIDRPNRFVAHVLVDGGEEVVHVKNTGRCKELLREGVQVILECSDNKNRKTAYDLICVYKENLGWVNIDSQAPNKVVNEWLKNNNKIFKDITFIKPEYVYGNSRIDFYLEQGERKILIEVKGCTLEIEGKGYFPDAPTIRGVKHLKELIKATREGYECYVAFVIAMEGVSEVYANEITHKEFADALEEARNAGVKVLNLKCVVTENELRII
ncbi:MAG: DNA/RNA nuclease SfsA [Lachnospiraceae bacterium]|nr:DNA/RNA nuclease SfsA [Lachnospiraceae bacterium]